MSLTTQNIHCKVSYDGQIRRFTFVGTEFTSLKEMIARLANVQGEFVLKYRDDESDYVTLENQEDLTTALMISHTLLRIAVETTNTLSSTLLRIAVETTNTPSCTSLENRKRQHDHHHYHHKKDRRDHHHNKTAGSSFESRRLRMEKKLVFINQCLIDLGTDDSKLTPRDLWRKKKKNS
jgi:ABC-type nickel/cobalt efflux system permease component RcnA